MIFLTEEDVRQRCELGQGGEFRLQAGERLTPAATELLRSRNSTVLVQTGFDGNNKLPAVLRNGLSDINVWLWQILQAEVSGEAVPAQSLCGMNAEAIRLVSHDPMKYLGQGHIVPDVALGPNVALLNWLRAQAREVEVAYVQVGMEREDILASLNRLSSAIYVLMLLTVVAESGRDISKVGL